MISFDMPHSFNSIGIILVFLYKRVNSRRSHLRHFLMTRTCMHVPICRRKGLNRRNGTLFMVNRYGKKKKPASI